MSAYEVLRKYQKQCDPEGIEVQVSRQALDEVLDELRDTQWQREIDATQARLKISDLTNELREARSAVTNSVLESVRLDNELREARARIDDLVDAITSGSHKQMMAALYNKQETE